MSGFKGTPGSWEVHQEDGEISIRQAGTTERGWGWSAYTQIAAELNNIHDAKLIADAPKLLQALQELVYASIHGVKNCSAQNAAIIKANAVIAKVLDE